MPGHRLSPAGVLLPAGAAGLATVPGLRDSDGEEQWSIFSFFLCSIQIVKMVFERYISKETQLKQAI